VCKVEGGLPAAPHRNATALRARRASVTSVACLPLLNGYCISQRNPSARVRRLTLGNRTWAAGALLGVCRVACWEGRGEGEGGRGGGGEVPSDSRRYLLGRREVWIPVVVVCRLACDCEVPRARAPCAAVGAARRKGNGEETKATTVAQHRRTKTRSWARSRLASNHRPAISECNHMFM